MPNSRARLADVVSAIVAGGPQKIGTELIFRRFPELLAQLGITDLVGPLLGGAQHVAAHRLGFTLTVPVFMASGEARARTDLHCEPIGNLMLQLGGSKLWTLVPPSESRFLRPAVAPDGRAYFYSRMAMFDPETSLTHVRRWRVESHTGDALWVPTWTWHRVDYLPRVTALSASLFHFRPEQTVHNPLYSALAVPNVLKELVGWKTQ